MTPTFRLPSTAAPVPGLGHVGALAAGGAHNCASARDADGAPALFCWGANGSGQLGNGSLVDAPVATRISALQPIGIAAGSAHTCAFPAIDKQLRCWGLGDIHGASLCTRASQGQLSNRNLVP